MPPEARLPEARLPEARLPEARLPEARLPEARLIDLTRLLSRAGRVLTGIDRVELAYLDHLLTLPMPGFALVRTPLGYLLLGRVGMFAIAKGMHANHWGQQRFFARLLRRVDPPALMARAVARRTAMARCLRGGLGRLLRRRLPQRFQYLNIGHSNLTDRTLSAIRALPGAEIRIMIHDTIPLDWPDLQREGTVPVFAAKLRRAGAFADVIVCPSAAAGADIARHLAQWGRVPRILPAHLGVVPVPPDPAALPPGLDLSAPYFVTLGTIEPRKNHALLLDAWAHLGPAPPRLFICGTRGWRNEGVFARLDAHPPGITELPGLSDAAVAALIAGATAFLFPSLAEGFGLPPVEAAALGTPVLCGDLAIWREVLGEVPVYLDLNDSYRWSKAVTELLADASATPRRPRPAPTWEAHFKIALSDP